MQKKRFHSTFYLLYILLLLVSEKTYADNYIGAELSMKPINTNGRNFRILLTQYMDNKYIPSTMTPLLESAVIWRKRDNQMMLFLNLRSKVDSARFVKFQNPKCAEANDLDIYRTTLFQDVFLDPTLYNDPQGYYIAFDRCCRPVNLTNITDSRNISLAIILEFSALNIKNSSPVFNIITVGDLLCKGKPFKVSMAATDVDGDELRYSIVNPLSGYTSLTSQEGPYFDLIPRINRRTVNWASGYNKDNTIIGTPPLRINQKTGEISVTPTEVGFYGFSILCEEFRNGVKIGSIQRDFAIKVIDCPVKTLSKPIVTYKTKPITSLDLCVGTSGIIMTDNNADWNYQWQKNGINIPSATTNELNISEKGVYTVITSSNKECTADINSDSIKIATVQTPSPPKIKSDKMEACNGENIKLSLQDITQSVDWFMNGILLKRDKTITVTNSGDYSAKTIPETTCPQQQDDIKLTFYAPPVLAQLPKSEYLICVGDTILLETDSRIDYSYQWSKDNGIISNATDYALKISSTGNYTVKVKENICETKSSIYSVKLKSSCGGSLETPIYMPNAFSPNGDSMNDSWEISNIDKYPNCEVSIFNRWGEIVFLSKGYSTPWDGTVQGQKVSAGNYTYRVKINENNIYSGILYVLY